MKKEVLEQELAQIRAALHSVDKTLAVNTQQLTEHMARTTQIEQELLPLVKFRQQMVGAGKLLGLLSLIASIIATFIALR